MDEKGTGFFPDCVYCGSTAGWQMGQKGQDPGGTGCQWIAGTHFSGSCLCFYRIYQNIRDKAVSVGAFLVMEGNLAYRKERKTGESAT